MSFSQLKMKLSESSSHRPCIVVVSGLGFRRETKTSQTLRPQNTASRRASCSGEPRPSSGHIRAAPFGSELLASEGEARLLLAVVSPKFALLLAFLCVFPLILTDPNRDDGTPPVYSPLRTVSIRGTSQCVPSEWLCNRGQKPMCPHL